MKRCFMLQYFLLPLLLQNSVLSCVLSNVLYAIAGVWYAYITHLGYRGNAVVLQTGYLPSLIGDASFCSSTFSGQHTSVFVVSHCRNLPSTAAVDSLAGSRS